MAQAINKTMGALQLHWALEAAFGHFKADVSVLQCIFSNMLLHDSNDHHQSCLSQEL
jgi:hypothetical protein